MITAEERLTELKEGERRTTSMLRGIFYMFHICSHSNMCSVQKMCHEFGWYFVMRQIIYNKYIYGSVCLFLCWMVLHFLLNCTILSLLLSHK